MIDGIVSKLFNVPILTEPGCTPGDRKLTDALQEFRDFYASTTDEVFVIMLDTPEPDNMVCQHCRLKWLLTA